MESQPYTRALIICDQQDLYKQIKAALGKEHHRSYHSEWAGTLAQAQNRNANDYDIVLATQHATGDTNDSDYLSALCQSYHDKALIILTDNHDQAAHLSVRRRGAQDCLHIDELNSPHYLAHSIHFAIERKQQESEQQQLNHRLQKCQADLAKHDERYQRDLAAARLVQDGLLPHDLDLPTAIKSAWEFKACPELAGDLFHIISLSEQQVAFYVLDVSGHGLASALLGMQVHHAIMENNQALLRDGPETLRPCNDVLTELNQMFQMKKPMLLYFTMLYGVIDLEQNHMHYASAGHPSPIIHKAEGHNVIPECTGVPIGMMPQSNYDVNQIPLEHGDRVFIYSDGIYECTNQYSEAYGRKRLVEHIQQYHHEELGMCLSHIMQAVQSWSDTQEQTDDFAICALELSE